MRAHPGRGFTLIELLVTLAIVAVLASMLAPVAQTQYKRAKERELRHALFDLRRAIDAHKDAADAGRIAKAAGASGFPASLALLVDGLVDRRDPKHARIFFLRRVPADPFSEDGAWGLRSYASDAAQPKTGEDVFDVYSTSTEIGTNGVPYRQW